MKKILILIIFLLILFFVGVNRVSAANAYNNQKTPVVQYTDVATYKASYYDSVVGKEGDALLEGLATLSNTKHRYYTRYDEIWGATCYSDADPQNPTTNIIDFYTQKSISNAYDTSTWNREHVWCQINSDGLYGTVTASTQNAGTDIHHIRPSIDNINSSRGDSYYGEVVGGKARYYSFKNDSVSNATSSDTLYGYLNGEQGPRGTFEPLDNVKGDAARIIMYMYMHYSNEVSANSKITGGTLKITNIIYTSEGTNQAAWDLLLEWNELDPVDELEENRNNYCASVTGLRNPFIDHPEFATIIWDSSYSGNGAMNDSNSDTDYQTLLSEYQNSGVYTKKSNINLNYKSKAEIQNYFHGEVAQDRTTYYNGEYLLMGDIDGSFNTINSGYRTDGKNVNHFTYQNSKVVDDYTVEGTTLHTMYVTMNKFKSNYLDNTWNDGVHQVTNKNDKYLADFLAFTAPCLTDYVISSNYLTYYGMMLEITEEKNSIGEHLVLRIYVDSTDSTKVSSDLILSEARIYKGNSKFDDSNLNSIPVLPEDTGSSSGGSSSGGSSSGGSSSGGSSSDSGSSGSGSTTTPVKTSFQYTFTSKVFTTEETKSLNGRNWRLTGTDGMYFHYNSEKGHQFGSNNSPAYKLQLTSTTDFDQITSIYIIACGAKDTQATLDICVSSVSYGERTLTDKPTTYRVTPGGVSGRVSFKFNQSTKDGVAKAIYIKEIKVYYTSGVSKTYTADGNIITEKAPVKDMRVNNVSLISDINLTSRYVSFDKKSKFYN